MAAPQAHPVSARHATDLSGTTVGRFVIRNRLGVGGMGEVYRAEDTLLKRPVALKRVAPHLRADERFRQRLFKEAERASAVTHPHIAAIHDVLEHKGDVFLVMEYAEGVTLREKLRGTLRLGQFLEIALQVADALAAVHDKGLVHGDIKPENIMVSADGKAKLLDFGVAKRLPPAEDSDLTQTSGTGAGGLVGTPGYMAPEVLLGKKIDGRADIFSLGVVCYEALSGGHPFREAGFVPTADRVLHQTPAVINEVDSSVTPDLNRIVGKMLAKDPADRYATVRDLLVDLRVVQRSGSSPILLPRPAAPGLSRRAWALLAGAAALVFLLLAAALLLPAIRRWLTGAAVPAQRCVAVLPFEPATHEQEIGALASGLTEVVTAQLTKLTATHQVQVIPAHEARKLRGLEQARELGELGANLAVTGSLQLWGDNARVTVNLVNVRDHRQLGGEVVDGSMRAPMELEDRAVAAVLDMLRLGLQAPERRALTAHGTQVAPAYEAYLQGRGDLRDYDRPENVDSAVESFRRALRLDSTYAAAHAALGEAYLKKYDIHKDKQWVDYAQRSCAQALSLDAKLAAAHSCLGSLYRQTGEYAEAAAEFNKALESEPTSDDAYRGLGAAYEGLNRFEDAEKTYQRAINLRPQYWAGYSWLGAFYYRRSRYSDAVQKFSRVIELAPENTRGYRNLGGVYIDMGRYREAIAVLEKSNALRPDPAAYNNLGAAYLRLRQFAKSTEYYRKALSGNEGDFTIWGNLGDSCYWTPGKREQAIAAYQQAIVLAKETLVVNARDTRALSTQAKCHARLGEKEAALRCLQQALSLAPSSASVLFTAALVHGQLGQTDQTLESLGKALAAGLRPIRLRDDPSFDDLRSNRRFQQLISGQQSGKSEGR